jgi:hypothetical protein
MVMTPVDLDSLSKAELKERHLDLLERFCALEEQMMALKDELARLKGGSGRPPIKPSGMERSSEGKQAKGRTGKSGRGPRNHRLEITEERIVKVDGIPRGSRFKGYQDSIVQDLEIRPRVIQVRRERWRTPDGRTIIAPPPAGLEGEFGPTLTRAVLALYHQGQMTSDRLVGLLGDLGLAISKREVVRILTAGKDTFLNESERVLRAGLETASWISVDDTGARHKAANGVTTQIGNSHFTWFGTTESKSRLNFLSLLRAGHDDYVVNSAALDYMRRHNLAGWAVETLEGAPDRHFANEAAWLAHLDQLGLGHAVTPDPIRLATEGALWGSVQAHGLLPHTVIVSDDAGQFNVGVHALCWIHAERLIHKLTPFTPDQEAARELVRHLIWWLYDDLKAYCRDPTPTTRSALRRRFERIFQRRTGFATLDRLLKRLHANKDELLRVLERPEIPLHTNGSENDVRCLVTRRKISAGTRSDIGRDCRDGFLSLMKTCGKLGISFWNYLGSRFGVEDAEPVPDLAGVVRARCAA